MATSDQALERVPRRLRGGNRGGSRRRPLGWAGRVRLRDREPTILQRASKFAWQRQWPATERLMLA